MKRLPDPTTGDLAKWRRLAREARKVGDDPALPAGDLAAAAKAANKCIVIGEISKHNACVQLVRASLQFAGETARGRLGVAPRLVQFAGEVEALAGAGGRAAAAPDEVPPPGRPPRADIFG